jgi:hypothetical protein
LLGGDLNEVGRDLEKEQYNPRASWKSLVL